MHDPSTVSLNTPNARGRAERELAFSRAFHSFPIRKGLPHAEWRPLETCSLCSSLWSYVLPHLILCFPEVKLFCCYLVPIGMAILSKSFFLETSLQIRSKTDKQPSFQRDLVITFKGLFPNIHYFTMVQFQNLTPLLLTFHAKLKVGGKQ